MDENSIELMIEEKYRGEAEYLLRQHDIEALSWEDGFGYVTLVGLGINLDPGWLARTLELCAPFGIRSVQHSDMTIELMLPSEQVRPCVLKLHQAFIGEEK